MKLRRSGIALLAGLAVACGEAGVRSYDARGVVEEVQPAYGQLVIDHEDIPGLMPAMTMNFDVEDPALLERLEPGQRIAFKLAYDGRRYTVTDAEVLGDGAGGDGPRLAALAEAADPAPGFDLVDQDGERVRLADLAGRAVLLDFVYTACPGPCPIQTGVHVQVQRELPDDVRDRVHLVSISLDPERDSPEAMRRYAEARGADFSGWSFLTGDPDTLTEVWRGYGVAVAPGKNGEIDHLVASFLIDAEGRIVRRYIGLDHPAEKLLRDLVAAARAAEPRTG